MFSFGSLNIDGLDYVMIINKEYKIIYNTRYDNRIDANSKDINWDNFIDKDFFEAYPRILRDSSSIVQCMETGEIVIKKNQYYEDYLGNQYVTNNVTFPLRVKGEIFAVVEMAMDVDAENTDELEKSLIDQKFDLSVKKMVGGGPDLITFNEILTANEEMARVIEKAKLFAEAQSPTLIYGETGTGKEMVAQAMINYSGISRKKVVVQNCAAVPDNLMESILFGTVKGAYTGAETRKGLFEEADGGIIFLDELNSMSFDVQAKLLRVLQDGTFRPLGSSTDKKVKVKVIAAMNVDPMEAIEKNILRKDLFYRLSGGMIILPPLRERKEDIGLFIRYYIRLFTELYGKRVESMEPGMERKMLSYEWEGNVRELKNVIEYMVPSASGGERVLTEAMLPPYMKDQMGRAGAVDATDPAKSQAPDAYSDADVILGMMSEITGGIPIPYSEVMETVERTMIEKALAEAGGNKTKASELLGLPRKTLQYRLEKLGIGVK